jgi:hypothetical protein
MLQPAESGGSIRRAVLEKDKSRSSRTGDAHCSECWIVTALRRRAVDGGLAETVSAENAVPVA